MISRCRHNLACVPTSDDEDEWGSEGPPDEAYSRVTRDLATLYAPLAPAAEDTVRRLIAGARRPRRRAGPVSRATEAVALVPGDESTPALTVAWTDLPGLTVRLGDGDTTVIPPCGCDACAESLPHCLDLLAGEVELAELRWAGIRR